jgi:plasmid stabilization system protein ParE
MIGYRLTPAADADLSEIWSFINGQSGAPAADRVEDQLHAAMHRLAKAPGIGHMRLDLANEALRFYSIHKFLIIYRPEQRPIEVVRVLHGSRDVASVLGSP